MYRTVSTVLSAWFIDSAVLYGRDCCGVSVFLAPIGVLHIAVDPVPSCCVLPCWGQALRFIGTYAVQSDRQHREWFHPT